MPVTRSRFPPRDPPDRPGARGRLTVRGHPGAATEGVRWDDWRKVWVVSVREMAIGGAANRAIVALIARSLGVRPDSVHLVRGATSPVKLVEIDGLSEEEIARRLAEAPRARHSATDGDI